jgi:hypothetical protein
MKNMSDQRCDELVLWKDKYVVTSLHKWTPLAR